MSIYRWVKKHEFPVPLDVLDAAIEEAFTNTHLAWVAFEREDWRSGRVVYTVALEEAAGTIALRKAGDKQTEIRFTGPARGRARSLTEEERSAIGQERSGQQRRMRLAEAVRRTREEHARRHAELTERFERITQGLVGYLVQDLGRYWPELL